MLSKKEHEVITECFENTADSINILKAAVIELYNRLDALENNK